MEILRIKNGLLLIEGEEIVYCRDMVELHKEIEYALGEPPKPAKINDPKPSGVREFDDED